MKIRSITCFYDPADSHAGQSLDRISGFVAAAVPELFFSNYEVQTTRLATTPFPTYLDMDNASTAISVAKTLEAAALQHGFSYLALGPALPSAPSSFDLIPVILGETQNVFFSAIMADSALGISLPAVKACAEINTRNARIAPDGFTNLRFGALANVRPGGPFLPAAYHDGDEPAYALAIECADEAVKAFNTANSLAEARQALLRALENASREIEAVLSPLARRFSIRFNGFDFSPAPFPLDACSLAGAIETLGGSRTGLPGSLAAAAVVADTLDQGSWKRAGFNGLMLPVLEDSVLAARSDDGVLEIKDLLLYSAICGTGLDTLPLPGDATSAEIEPVLLDVATLALRLGKPLIARLMPVPGKHAGDRTEFDFGYFANGRILKLPSAPRRGGLLTGDETYPLSMRGHNE